jgi:hypothetical protein
MEYAVRHDRELYILLLDASEAYTSIPFELIIIAFKRLGASDLYCNFIWSILQNQSWNLTSIYGMAEGDPIKPTAGAPQGGPLSPIIFIVVQDLIASHINIHGNSLGFQLKDNDLETDTTVSNMIIVDDVTMTSGTAENAQKLLDLAAEINIACGIRGNPSKTLISHSPAAYRKSCSTDGNGIIQKPVYIMSMLNNRMQIQNNEVIPPKGILAPQDEFRMLGVFLRFIPSNSDPQVTHISAPNKWTLAFKAAEKLCHQVSHHLKYRNATIKGGSYDSRAISACQLSNLQISTGTAKQC